MGRHPFKTALAVVSLALLAALATGAALAATGSARRTLAPPAFGTPAKLSTAFSRNPDVGVDGQGNALAAWTTIGARHATQIAARPAGGVFGDAGTIFGSTAGNPEGNRIAVGAAGNAAVVWENAGDGHEVAASVRPSNGQFAAAQVLSRLADPLDTDSSPQVAVGSSGNAVAAWEHHDAATNTTSVQAAVARNGRFGPPQTISPAGVEAFTPSVGMDAHGNAVALFSTQLDDATSGVQYALAPAGGSFSAARTLSTAVVPANEVGNYPQVAVSPSGAAVAAWEGDCSDCQLYVAAALGTTAAGFGAPVSLTDPNVQDAWGPQVAIDASGAAVVVWPFGAGTQQEIQGAFGSGGSFGATATIAAFGDTGWDTEPDVAIAGGEAYVVWTGRGSGDSHRIWGALGSPGGWEQAQALSSAAGDADQPAVVIDAQGRVVALWRQGSDSIGSTASGPSSPSKTLPPPVAAGGTGGARPGAGGTQPGAGGKGSVPGKTSGGKTPPKTSGGGNASGSVGGGASAGGAPGCKGTVTFGVFTLSGDCLRNESTTPFPLWVSEGKISLNGIGIEPASAGARIEVDTDPTNLYVRATGQAKVSLQIPVYGQLTLYQGSFDESLTGADAAKAIDLPTLPSLAPKIAGFPISGDIHCGFITGGASCAINASVPFLGVSGSIAGRLTMQGGLALDGLHLRVDSIEIPGPGGLEIHDFDLTYDGGTDTWQGTAEVIPPTWQTAIRAGATVTKGSLTAFHAQADRLNVPLAAGIDLQRVGIDIKTGPLALSGTIGISLGPNVLGTEAMALDGTIGYTFSNPGVFRLEGDLKVAGYQLASGYVRYVTDGTVEFGGTLDYYFDDSHDFGVDVGLDGWVTSQAFDADAHGTVTLFGDRIGGHVIVSSVGLAACGSLSGWEVGFSYKWDKPDQGLSTYGYSCNSRVDFVHAARSTLGGKASVPSSFALPVGLTGTQIAVVGESAPPVVTLTGPNGETYSTPTSGSSTATASSIVYARAGDRTTYFLIAKPAAGTWTISVDGSSSPVVDLKLANSSPLPPVTATVSAAGARRTLTWKTASLGEGQSVTFVEQGAGGVAQLLGKATTANGTLRFTPADGPAGKRTIMAIFSQQNGVPGAHVAVSSYAAPGRAVPARPGSLTLKRAGSRLVVAWPPAKGAVGYAVKVRLSDGRRLALGSRTRSIVLPNLTADDHGTISVQGLSAHRFPGPAVTATLKAPPRAKPKLRPAAKSKR